MRLRPSHIEARSQSTMQFLLLSPNFEVPSVSPLTRIHSSRERKPRDTRSNFSQEKDPEYRNPPPRERPRETNATQDPLHIRGGIQCTNPRQGQGRVIYEGHPPTHPEEGWREHLRLCQVLFSR